MDVYPEIEGILESRKENHTQAQDSAHCLGDPGRFLLTSPVILAFPHQTLL